MFTVMHFSKLGVLSILFFVGLLGCANTKFGATSVAKKPQIVLDEVGELQILDETGQRVPSCQNDPAQKLCNPTGQSTKVGGTITMDMYTGNTPYHSSCCRWTYLIMPNGSKYPICTLVC